MAAGGEGEGSERLRKQGAGLGVLGRKGCYLGSRPLQKGMSLGRIRSSCLSTPPPAPLTLTQALQPVEAWHLLLPHSMACSETQCAQQRSANGNASKGSWGIGWEVWQQSVIREDIQGGGAWEGPSLLIMALHPSLDKTNAAS